MCWGEGGNSYIICHTRNFQDTFVSRASKRNCARRKKTALGPRGLVEISLKIEDLRSTIKLLVNCHKCFISCSAECPNSINCIQSSDKHNQLHVIQQAVICLSCFIVNKIWSTAIKIIYQIFL